MAIIKDTAQKAIELVDGARNVWASWLQPRNQEEADKMWEQKKKAASIKLKPGQVWFPGDPLDGQGDDDFYCTGM